MGTEKVTLAELHYVRLKKTMSSPQELDDMGVFWLMHNLIQLAKRDVYEADINRQYWAERYEKIFGGKSDEEVEALKNRAQYKFIANKYEDSIEGFKRASKFFDGDLFQSICDIPGDEYVAKMLAGEYNLEGVEDDDNDKCNSGSNPGQLRRLYSRQSIDRGLLRTKDQVCDQSSGNRRGRTKQIQ